MSLRFERHRVQSAGVGSANRRVGGHLEISPGDLSRYLAQSEDLDKRINAIRVHVARPGDPIRILCCKDVIQPRVKVNGNEPGSGVVRVLENVAVVTCGPIVGFQEGIIDMSGPGAVYTPFSELFLIVLELTAADGLTQREHEATVRAAGIAAARCVADACGDGEPNAVEDLVWNETEVDATLPRIAYVDMLLSQGLLHDTYLLGERVLGESAMSGLPRIFDPRVLLDDGIVSGNCVSACDKNTTFHHQNNPIIQQLLRGHGSRWNFVGVVATNLPTRLADKERSAQASIALAQEIKADGVIISKEGFGNPDADLMMIVRGLEQAGIRSVAITDEFAGSDGGSQSLADVTPEADAIISTGNANQKIQLPAMANVIGSLPDVARLAGGYAGNLRPDGSLEVELQAIMGATSELGFSRLSCRSI